MTGDWREVESAGRRAFTYWYVDGLTEIGTGILLMLVGLLFGIEDAAATAPLARATVYAIIVLLISGTLLMHRLIEAAKQRLTYRRTGYVAYHRRPRWRSWLGAAIGAILAAAVTALLNVIPDSVRWLPVIQGVVMALALALTGRHYGVSRFYLYAALALLIGIAVGGQPWSSDRAAAVCCAGPGLVLTVGGLATLALYLRHSSTTLAD